MVWYLTSLRGNVDLRKQQRSRNLTLSRISWVCYSEMYSYVYALDLLPLRICVRLDATIPYCIHAAYASMLDHTFSDEIHLEAGQQGSRKRPSA